MTRAKKAAAEVVAITVPLLVEAVSVTLFIAAVAVWIIIMKAPVP